MKANETIFQPIIEGTKQYVVPLFQRPYSWSKKEWEILWEDLVELCQEDNQRSHFIGSIVTMPTGSVPEGVAKFLLIDGQQRLTTIFILLAMLRDQAKQNNQTNLAAEIDNTLLVNPYNNDSDYYKLQPTQLDRESFKNIIHSEQPFKGDQISQAYQFFERKFRQSGLDSQALKKVVCKDLIIVSIVLHPDDNPHLVFESLNAKGRPLSQADLIRNYFFMKIHVSQQESVYSQYWQPMQEALKDSLTEFIRHYLIMNSGIAVKQSDVYFSLKEAIGKLDALESLKNLARFAGYYEKLLYPDQESNSDIRRALIRLNRIQVTIAYPLLMHCYDDYYQNKLTVSDFVSIIKVIENYMIRRFVCNIPTNPLSSIFSPLYSQVGSTNPDNFVDGLKSILQNRNYPKDNEFKFHLMSAKLYGSGDRTAKTKLILESLEEFYNHKEQASFDNLTIEHVMPQTLTEYWQSHLGDDWEETYETLLHTIGNLTLTAYNAELSNDDFDSKRKRLGDSHLEINSYFQDKASWKREDIEARSEHLANNALLIWPYFGDERAVVSNASGIATGTTPQKLWILGQHFIVESWRDVLEQTMNTIADLEPEKFEQIMQQYPRYVGRDNKKFRATRELSNGAFIEVNLSARDIQRLCTQAIGAIDLTANDWKVDAI